MAAPPPPPPITAYRANDNDDPFDNFWEDTMIIWIVLGIPLVAVPLLFCLLWCVKRTPCYLPFMKKTASFWIKEHRFRKKLRYLMNETVFSHIWNLFQLVITFLSLIHYAATTYYETIPLWLFMLDVAMTTCFTIDYAIFMYIARNKVKHFFGLMSIIDFLTVLPVYVSLITWSYADNTSVRFTPLRMLRALRVVRTVRAAYLFKDLVTRQALKIAIMMLSLVFISTALVQLIEELWDGFQLDFHIVLWYIVVTYSTVGYGDITPVTDQGKMAVVVLIILSYILLPYQLAKFFNVMAQSKDYFLRVYTKRWFRPPLHVVFLGQEPDIETVEELFNEELNPSANVMQAVILTSNKPSPDMEVLLKKSKYKHRLFYLQGSPTSDSDLKRAMLSDAEYCYIFSGSSADGSTDQVSLLTYLAVKAYSSDIPVALQLQNDPGTISTAIFAQSCHCPGFSTFLTNLLRVSAPQSNNMERRKRRRRGGWQEEYVKGTANQLYALEELPLSFKGLHFSEAAKLLFKYYHVLLLGVECVNPSLLNDTIEDPSAKTSRGPTLLGSMKNSTVRLKDAKNNVQIANQRGALVMLPTEYVIQGGEMAAVISPSSDVLQAIDLHDILLAKKAKYQGNDNKMRKMRRLLRKETQMTLAALNDLGGDPGEKNPPGTAAEEIPATSDDSGDEAAKRLAVQKMLKEVELEKLTNINKPGRTALHVRRAIARAIMKPQYLVDIGLGSRIEVVSQPTLSMEELTQHNFHKIDVWTALRKRSGDDIWGSLFYLNPPYNAILEGDSPPIVPIIRFENHVLLIGWRVGLETLVLGLRGRNIRFPRRIVILSPIPPASELWVKLSLFPHIYFVQGSGLEERDLHRAGVAKAGRIIILDKPSSNNNDNESSSSEEKTLIDAEKLFTLRTIQAFWPEKIALTSIADAQNMRFSEEETTDTYMKRLAKLYSTSPHSTYNFLGPFAAGRLYTPSLMNSVLIQLFWSPRMLHMIKLLTGCGTTLMERLCGCNLWAVSVPSGLVGKSFKKLFCRMLTQKSGLAVALYRRKNSKSERHAPSAEYSDSDNDSSDDDKEEIEEDSDAEKTKQGDEEGHHWECFDEYLVDNQKAAERYVYTNPHPRTTLLSDDKVFLMALSEPEFMKDKQWQKKKQDMQAAWLYDGDAESEDRTSALDDGDGASSSNDGEQAKHETGQNPDRVQAPKQKKKRKLSLLGRKKEK
ncbi:potassium channel, subfamily T, member 2 [Balamuthia mandrillaris]